MTNVLVSVLIMAVVTYIIRAIPLVSVRGKIQSPFIRSFLYYIPYTVLAAMTFPAILFSTPSVYSAAAGFGVALILAFYKRGLMTVAGGSVAAALLVEFFLGGLTL